jgi:glycosyltransferase involved in cell wall biosynthesis
VRIGFNARLLHASTLRGWNRYAVNLLVALPARGVEVLLYSDRPVHPDHLERLPAGASTVRLSPRMRYVRWEQCWLPRQLARDEVALIHTPFHFGLPWSSPCPRVLTQHDAIDVAYREPDMPRAPRLRAWQAWLHAAIARRRAHIVITVSEHARLDILRHYRIEDRRIVVIPEAADPAFRLPIPDDRRATVRRRYDLTGPYVFYVGGFEGRKNVPLLVRAFAAAELANVSLVLAGGTDEEGAAVRTLATALGIGARVRFPGRVPDGDLPALYAEAICFAYPSRYEGFGLQLVEAMAVGCPTFAAAATSLPEVLGAGGDTFPLDAPSALAVLLRRVASDPAYRRELSARGLARARDFSWDQTAERTAAVYRRLIEGM